jgi:hypothetical protein
VIIRKFESRAPFTCPLCVETGQRGADQHQEEICPSADCDLSLGAQFAFNFLLIPIVLPTADCSIGTFQEGVLVTSMEARLARRGTFRIFKVPS